MATIDLRQTNNGLAPQVGCSGKSLTAGARIGRRIEVGGIAGISEATLTFINSETTVVAYTEISAAAISEEIWQAGNYTWRFNVTTTSGDITLEEVHVCRFDRFDVSQESLGSSTGIGQSLGTSGVVSGTVSGSAATSPDSLDRIGLIYVFSNGSIHGGDDSVGFTPDQLINTPIEESIKAVEKELTLTTNAATVNAETNITTTLNALTLTINAAFVQSAGKLFPQTVEYTFASSNAHLVRSLGSIPVTGYTVLEIPWTTQPPAGTRVAEKWLRQGMHCYIPPVYTDLIGTNNLSTSVNSILPYNRNGASFSSDTPNEVSAVLDSEVTGAVLWVPLDNPSTTSQVLYGASGAEADDISVTGSYDILLSLDSSSVFKELSTYSEYQHFNKGVYAQASATKGLVLASDKEFVLDTTETAVLNIASFSDAQLSLIVLWEDPNYPSHSEIKSLTKNPWQIFEPKRVYLPDALATTTPVNINASTTVAMTLATSTATIDTTDRNITTTTKSLTLTTYNAHLVRSLGGRAFRNLRRIRVPWTTQPPPEVPLSPEWMFKDMLVYSAADSINSFVRQDSNSTLTPTYIGSQRGTRYGKSLDTPFGFDLSLPADWTATSVFAVSASRIDGQFLYYTQQSTNFFASNIDNTYIYDSPSIFLGIGSTQTIPLYPGGVYIQGVSEDFMVLTPENEVFSSTTKTLELPVKLMVASLSVATLTLEVLYKNEFHPSKEQARKLVQNPWIMFEPKVVWVPSGTGTIPRTNINASTTVAMTLATSTATIDTTNWTVLAVEKSLTLTTNEVHLVRSLSPRQEFTFFEHRLTRTSQPPQGTAVSSVWVKPYMNVLVGNNSSGVSATGGSRRPDPVASATPFINHGGVNFFNASDTAFTDFSASWSLTSLLCIDGDVSSIGGYIAYNGVGLFGKKNASFLYELTEDSAQIKLTATRKGDLHRPGVYYHAESTDYDLISALETLKDTSSGDIFSNNIYIVGYGAVSPLLVEYRDEHRPSISEAEALVKNPWQIFDPIRIQIPVLANTNNRVNINASTTVTKTLATIQATVDAPVGGATNVTTILNALILTKETAGVNAETSVTTTLNALTLTTGQAIVGAGTNITTDLNVLTLTTNQVTVNAETSVTTTLNALTLTTDQATINAETSLTTTLTALTLTTNPATVNAEIDVTTILNALTLATLQSDVNLNKFVTTTLNTLTLTTNQATIVGTAAVTTTKVTVPIRRLRTEKPEGYTGIDWNSPLSQGLTAAFIFNEPNALPRNLAKVDVTPTASSTAPTASIRNGERVLDFGTDSRYIDLNGLDSNTFQLSGQEEISVAWCFVRTASGGADEETIVGNQDGSGDADKIFLLIRYDSVTSSWECSVRESGNHISAVFAASQSLNEKAINVYTYDGTCHFYKNGKSVANTGEEGTGNPIVTNESNSSYWIGNSEHNPTADYWRGYGLFLYVWSGRALSPSEAKAITSNPYQVLQPQVSLLTTVTSASIDIDVITTTNALTLTTGQATVNSETSVTTTLNALTLTTGQATVNAETSVTTTLNALTLATIQSDVNLNKFVITTLNSFTLNVDQVSVKLNKFVFTILDAHTLVTGQATIVYDVDVGTTLKVLVLTPNQATITADSSIVTVTEALALATLQATVNAETSITTTLNALTLAALTSDVNLNKFVNTTLNALILTTGQATIVYDVDVGTTLKTLTLTTFSATVNIGTNIDTTLKTLTLTTGQATVGAETSITTTLNALTLATIQSDVNLNKFVNTTLNALTLTTGQATVNAGINITTTLNALTLATGQATINAGINITTTLNALTLTALQSSVGFDNVIVTTLKTLTLATGQATITTDSSIITITEALILTTGQATVNAETSIITTLNALTLATIQSDVNLNKFVNTTLNALTLTTDQATVNAETSVTITLNALILTTGQATVSAETGIITTLNALTLATLTSDVNLNKFVNTTLNALTLTTGQAIIGAGTNITTTLNALILTTGQATIVYDVDVGTTLETLTLAKLASDVNLNKFVNTTLNTLTLTTDQATVNAEINVNTTLKALVLSSIPATIITDSSIVATTKALTLTTGQATVNAETSITTATKSLSISADQTSVKLNKFVTTILDTHILATGKATVNAETSIEATLKAFTLATGQATVNAETNTNTTLNALTLTTDQATIVYDVDVGTTLKTLTLTTLAATVAEDAGVVTTLKTFTLATGQATVNAETGVTTTLNALTLATIQSDVNLDKFVNTNLNALTLTTGQATVGAETSITTTLNALALTTSQAAVNAEISVTTTLNALTLTTLTSDTNLNKFVNTTLNALTLATGQATIVYDVNVPTTTKSLVLSTGTGAISLDIDIITGVVELTRAVLPSSIKFDVGVTTITNTLNIVVPTVSINAGSSIQTLLESLTLTTNQASVINYTYVNPITNSLSLTTYISAVGVHVFVGATTVSFNLLTYTPGINILTSYNYVPVGHKFTGISKATDIFTSRIKNDKDF